MKYREIYKPSFLNKFQEYSKEIGKLEVKDYKININDIIKVIGLDIKTIQYMDFVFDLPRYTKEINTLYRIKDNKNNKDFLAYQLAIKFLYNDKEKIKKVTDQYGNLKDEFYTNIENFINELLAPRKLVQKLLKDYPDITTDEIASKMGISYIRACNITYEKERGYLD